MTVEREPGPDRELHDYVLTFRKHWGLMAGVFLLTVITVAVWTFRQVPIFQAAATILIEPEAPKVLNIQEVSPVGAAAPWDPNYYPTQYEIMQSRAVLDKALGILNGKAGANGQQGALPGALTVEPRRNTRLVMVKVEHPDPATAAAVANAVATAYVRYNLDLKLRGAQEALTWLTEEAARLRTKVHESSAAIQNYRMKSGIIGAEEQRKIAAQKIMDFNKAYLEAQAQRLSIDAKLRELLQIARDKSGAQTIFTVADSFLIQKLKAEASDLEVERSKLLKTYKESHPEVVKFDARLQQVNLRLDAEIQTMLRAVQTEYKVAKAREETMLGNVNELRREGQEQTEKEAQYVSLQREHESNQQLYESVVKRLKETGVTGGLETNNARVVEEARPPAAPVRPKKAWNLTLSVVGGLVLAVGLAFLVDRFDVTVKTPDDVERHDLAVIGIIPRFPRRR